MNEHALNELGICRLIDTRTRERKQDRKSDYGLDERIDKNCRVFLFGYCAYPVRASYENIQIVSYTHKHVRIHRQGHNRNQNKIVRRKQSYRDTHTIIMP